MPQRPIHKYAPHPKYINPDDDPGKACIKCGLPETDECHEGRESPVAKNKHDSDCMRRKEKDPLLCTCGFTDVELARVTKK